MLEESAKTLDAYHWHEALDRTSICMETVDRLILFHPVVEHHKSLKTKAEEAHHLLFQIYQEIGSLTLDKADNK